MDNKNLYGEKMTKIRTNKKFIEDMYLLKANSLLKNLIFILPNEGEAVLVSNLSNQGDQVIIFESKNGEKLFHYNMYDAILENKDSFPVGETFTTDEGSSFIVIAKCKANQNNFFCIKLNDKFGLDKANQGSRIFSYLEINNLIIKSSERPRDIFEWIKSHDPDQNWDFSNPGVVEDTLNVVIKESGNLNLRSLMYLLESHSLDGTVFNSVPESDKANIAVWQSWPYSKTRGNGPKTIQKKNK